MPNWRVDPLGYGGWLLGSFAGRIGRLPFWVGSGLIIVTSLLLEDMVGRFVDERLGAFVTLALIFPSAALMKKRMNDRDVPDHWLFVLLAPDFITGFLTVTGLLAEGLSPSPAVTLLLLAAFVITIGLIVELGLKPGMSGPNRHGPEPS